MNNRGTVYSLFCKQCGVKVARQHIRDIQAEFEGKLTGDEIDTLSPFCRRCGHKYYRIKQGGKDKPYHSDHNLNSFSMWLLMRGISHYYTRFDDLVNQYDIHFPNGNKLRLPYVKNGCQPFAVGFMFERLDEKAGKLVQKKNYQKPP
jgi:hypothetical protein